MARTEVYDRIYAQITDQTVKDVYCEIRDYVGKEHAISKEAVSLVIWKKYTPSTDRVIRDCVEILHEIHGVPICTNSGTKGYYIAKDKAELNEYLAEMRSRRSKLDITIRKMEHALNTWNFQKPSHHIPASIEAVQLDLLSMPAAHREGAYV